MNTFTNPAAGPVVEVWFAQDFESWLQSQQERLTEITEQNGALMARADEANRDLTEDENAEITESQNEFDRIMAEVEMRRRQQASTEVLADMLQPARRQTEPDPVGGRPNSAADRPEARAAVPGAPRRPARAANPGEGDRHGFHNFGDFAYAVRRAGNRQAPDIDRRLSAAAATTFGNESVGADGGFLVPPEFRDQIMEVALGADSLVSRTDGFTSAGNQVVFPSDMTTPWDNTKGIQAYWEGEAAPMAQSRPSLGTVQMRLHKLTALVPVTEEMLEDAPAMGSYVGRKAPEKIDWKVSQAIFEGSGVGQPLGFMRSKALITVAAESGQAAASIDPRNITKMHAVLPSRLRRNGIWLVHRDIEEQLPHMLIGDRPIYMPPGGLADAQFGRLLGRPVIEHELCEAAGTPGDIVLVDLSQYMTARKVGGIRQQTSIHLWFDQDLVAFKFTLRMAGQPWWAEAVAANKGGGSYSPFAALAARD